MYRLDFHVAGCQWVDIRLETTRPRPYSDHAHILTTPTWNKLLFRLQQSTSFKLSRHWAGSDTVCEFINYWSSLLITSGFMLAAMFLAILLVLAHKEGVAFSNQWQWLKRLMFDPGIYGALRMHPTTLIIDYPLIFPVVTPWSWHFTVGRIHHHIWFKDSRPPEQQSV